GLPGFDQITVPGASGPFPTVTSADPVPDLILTCPCLSAVNCGGSSDDKLTTVPSLTDQLSPVTACPFESTASSVRVSPTAILSKFGRIVFVPPLTVNVLPLLVTPPCCTLTIPLTAPTGTVTTTDVSLQL